MIKILVSILFLFSFSMAYGQILVDPSMVTGHMTGSLGFSKVNYEYENHNTFEISRKTIGLGLVAPINPSVGFLFQGGYTFEAKDDGAYEGKGYMIGGGLNFLIHQGSKVNFVGYGLLNYIQEQYECPKKLDLDFSVMDVHFGGLVVFKASPNVQLYFGPDFVIYSDGELKTKYHKSDIKRDEVLNLKAGLNIGLDNGLSIRPEITFMNEQTLMLSLNF